MKQAILELTKQEHWLVSHTHHKTKSILQVDFPNASVSLEKLLHVSLPGVWAQVANEDTTAAHCYLLKQNSMSAW